MAEGMQGLDEEGQQLMYAVGADGETFAYIYQTEEEGSEGTQYLLSSGDVSQLAQGTSSEAYDTNQFLVAASQAEQSMDTGEGTSAVLTTS